MITMQTIVYALLGGVVPSLVWLWFWRRLDVHPEPRHLIALTFIGGMIAVALVIPLQKFALVYIGGSAVVLLWSAIEEIMKLAIGYVVVLRHREVNEPIDPVIYMITIALGFAAAENMLFLINPLIHDGLIDSILTGNFRFLGATLLHVLSSSVVGVMLAFSFYKRPRTRFWYTIVGLILAVILHGLFNFFILKATGGEILRVFAFVWIGLILLMILFEKVKRLAKPAFYTHLTRYLRTRK